MDKNETKSLFPLFHLVACSGCGYSFWTTEDANTWSPHCRYGRWEIDHYALDVPVGGWLESPNLSSKRREIFL